MTIHPQAAITCFHCAKPIRDEIKTVPSFYGIKGETYRRRLPDSFHLKCYAIADKLAEQELRGAK